MECKPTRFQNGIEVGNCLILRDDTEINERIREADANYQATNSDDIINCDGTFNVTLPPIAEATNSLTITSTNGTITLLSDATIQSPTTVTTGSGVSLYPARGQWWHE